MVVAVSIEELVVEASIEELVVAVSTKETLDCVDVWEYESALLEVDGIDDKVLDSVAETRYDSRLVDERLLDETVVLDIIGFDTASELNPLDE